MRKIVVSVISLCIFCCVSGLVALVASEAEGYDQEYTSLLSQGDTEKAGKLFWNRINSIDMKSTLNLKTMGNKALEAINAATLNMQAESMVTEMVNMMDSVITTEQYDFGVSLYSELLTYFRQELGGKKELEALSSLARTFRGISQEKKGEYEIAIADYQSSNAFTELAWLLATCPNAAYRDGEKALEYAERAIGQAKKEQAKDFKSLAAAYAEVGNFPEAIKAQEKAMALPGGADQEHEQYLAAYKAGTPWRIGMSPPKIESPTVDRLQGEWENVNFPTFHTTITVTQNNLSIRLWDTTKPTEELVSVEEISWNDGWLTVMLTNLTNQEWIKWELRLSLADTLYGTYITESDHTGPIHLRKVQ